MIGAKKIQARSQRLAAYCWRGVAIVAIGAGIAATPVAAKSLYTEPKYAAILVNSATGEVLYARQADAPRLPASITKVLTLYIAFEEISKHQLRQTDLLTISRHAASQAPSKLGLRPGATISVQDAIGVIATKSANDIAVALAERISGSEDAFAARMTLTARRLGMKSSQFVNATGLPDDRQLTTARDIATLSRAVIRDYPQFYPVFSQVAVEYDGREIENHNHLLSTLPGVDGIKTGYTAAAGFTLAASMQRGSTRLIAVVLGGPSRLARDNNVSELLQVGFDVADRRQHGEHTTVAQNLAEPEDLSDGVLEQLVEQGSGDDLLTATARPPRLQPANPTPPPLLAKTKPAHKNWPNE
jgi:D-alanyl-D-alanine carboxypeptidase